ncbi:hypothetical protein ACR3K2_36280 [Cryptosporidium serpentis]
MGLMKIWFFIFANALCLLGVLGKEIPIIKSNTPLIYWVGKSTDNDFSSKRSKSRSPNQVSQLAHMSKSKKSPTRYSTRNASDKSTENKNQFDTLLEDTESLPLSDKSEVTSLLDNSEASSLLDKSKASTLLDKSKVSPLLDKSEVSPLLDKSEVSTLLDKSEVSTLLDKSEASTLLDKSEVSPLLDKSEASTLLNKSEALPLLETSQNSNEITTSIPKDDTSIPDISSRSESQLVDNTMTPFTNEISLSESESDYKIPVASRSADIYSVEPELESAFAQLEKMKEVQENAKKNIITEKNLISKPQIESPKHTNTKVSPINTSLYEADNSDEVLNNDRSSRETSSSDIFSPVSLSLPEINSMELLSSNEESENSNIEGNEKVVEVVRIEEPEKEESQASILEDQISNEPYNEESIMSSEYREQEISPASSIDTQNIAENSGNIISTEDTSEHEVQKEESENMLENTEKQEEKSENILEDNENTESQEEKSENIIGTEDKSDYEAQKEESENILEDNENTESQEEKSENIIGTEDKSDYEAQKEESENILENSEIIEKKKQSEDIINDTNLGIENEQSQKSNQYKTIGDTEKLEDSMQEIYGISKSDLNIPTMYTMESEISEMSDEYYNSLNKQDTDISEQLIENVDKNLISKITPFVAQLQRRSDLLRGGLLPSVAQLQNLLGCAPPCPYQRFFLQLDRTLKTISRDEAKLVKIVNIINIARYITMKETTNSLKSYNKHAKQRAFMFVQRYAKKIKKIQNNIKQYKKIVFITFTARLLLQKLPNKPLQRYSSEELVKLHEVIVVLEKEFSNLRLLIDNQPNLKITLIRLLSDSENKNYIKSIKIYLEEDIADISSKMLKFQKFVSRHGTLLKVLRKKMADAGYPINKKFVIFDRKGLSKEQHRAYVKSAQMDLKIKKQYLGKQYKEFNRKEAQKWKNLKSAIKNVKNSANIKS